MELRFRRGNKIPYIHDGFAHRGIPSRVEFKAEYVNDGTTLRMVAPGYGGKPFGNGAIYVEKIDLTKDWK